jgi:hypothetical protein
MSNTYGILQQSSRKCICLPHKLHTRSTRHRGKDRVGHDILHRRSTCPRWSCSRCHCTQDQLASDLASSTHRRSIDIAAEYPLHHKVDTTYFRPRTPEFHYTVHYYILRQYKMDQDHKLPPGRGRNYHTHTCCNRCIFPFRILDAHIEAQ